MKPHQRIRGRQIGLVHVAKAQLIEAGVLTEESYRDCLARYGNGAKSSTALTAGQLEQLLEHFKKCGFVYRPKVKKAPRIRRQRLDRQQYLAAIEKLLNDLGKDWAYAQGIARRMQIPEQLQWLEPEQLHQIQVALTYEWRKQRGDPVARKPETLARRAAAAAAKRSAGGDAR